MRKKRSKDVRFVSGKGPRNLRSFSTDLDAQHGPRRYREELTNVFDELEPGDMIMCVPKNWTKPDPDLYQDAESEEIRIKKSLDRWAQNRRYSYCYGRKLDNQSEYASTPIRFGQTGLYLGVLKSKKQIRSSGKTKIMRRHCCWFNQTKCILPEHCVISLLDIVNVIGENYNVPNINSYYKKI